MKWLSLLCLGALTITLTACSSDSTKDPYEGQPANVIYAAGHQDMKKGDYDRAITAFQSLNAQYPFEKFSKMGDLQLIYAQYQEDNPALALAAADRYIRLFGNSTNVAYAYYMRGVVNFDNGRGFLQRYFPYDMAKHNPEAYKLAYDDFKTVVTQFPKSQYASDARRRMIYLVNTMAQYQINVATYYFDLKAYVATVNRCINVVLHYPRTPQVETALALMVQSYSHLELKTLAATAEKMLHANFPNNTTAKRYAALLSVPTASKTLSTLPVQHKSVRSAPAKVVKPAKTNPLTTRPSQRTKLRVTPLQHHPLQQERGHNPHVTLKPMNTQQAN